MRIIKNSYQKFKTYKPLALCISDFIVNASCSFHGLEERYIQGRDGGGVHCPSRQTGIPWRSRQIYSKDTLMPV